MNFQEYQEACKRTANRNLTKEQCLSNWAMGICGEAGEVSELLKKYLYHNKELDIEKLKLELGDVVFYISSLCSTVGLSLEEVFQANVDKLKARYPNGFPALIPN